MVAASPQGEIGTEEWETTPFVIKALSFKRSSKNITNVTQKQRLQAKSKESYPIARIIILFLENCFIINSPQAIFSLHGSLFPLKKPF